jgi:hypothetical protein
MLNLFTSSKKRQERRLLKLCLNIEKPARLAPLNTLGTPAILVQPVAKSDDGAPLVRNVIGSPSPPNRRAGEALFVARNKGR